MYYHDYINSILSKKKIQLILKGIVSVQVNDRILHVPKLWQNEGSLQVLQKNYKHTGYDNNYIKNLAISSICRSTCTCYS
jgi:hypothetical protein